MENHGKLRKTKENQGKQRKTMENQEKPRKTKENTEQQRRRKEDQEKPKERRIKPKEKARGRPRRTTAPQIHMGGDHTMGGWGGRGQPGIIYGHRGCSWMSPVLCIADRCDLSQ